MRIARAGVIVAFIATSCTQVGTSERPSPPPPVTTRTTPSPYARVMSGDVSAMVPKGWRAVPTPTVDGVRGGFFASPRPRAWVRMDGTVPGMSATWVDATKVGVPSDYYYLAATGPLLERLTDGRCRAVRNEIFANHRPGFDGSRGPSPGDYVARAHGRCAGPASSTRWASFVAAPGYGPARRVGIPGSGLYVVVAVLPASTGTGLELDRLLRHTAFGGTTVPQLVGAVTGRVPVPS
jgi:hypothetical protein